MSANVDGTELGSATADGNGNFAITIPKQKAGTKIVLFAKDSAENKSEDTNVDVIDKTAPDKPIVNEVNDQSTSVTGKSEKGALVIVKKGDVILGQEVANDDGDFKVTIEKQNAETKLTVNAKDLHGNIGEATEVTVMDKTAPEKPTVNEVTNLDSLLTGKAEPGSNVTVMVGKGIIGSTVADTKGTFTIPVDNLQPSTNLLVTASDKAGNVSNVNTVIVKGAFLDVPSTLHFHDEITFLTDKGIITGFNDGTFRPNDTVTRAQAAIMIGRALDLNGEKRATIFKDVGATSVASGYIASAVEKGIITGYPDKTFRPNEPVTRGQMAIFLARAFNLTKESDAEFSDVGKSSAAYPYIKRILEAKITNGYTDGTFRPNNQLVRGDFSAFMARALKK